AAGERVGGFERELAGDREAGEEMAGELRRCTAQEADIHAQLRTANEQVTVAEVAAQRLRSQAEEAELELRGVLERLGEDGARTRAREQLLGDAAALGEEERAA